MHLSSLYLKNFRNYQETNLQFSPGLNILHGDNAQGKTNLLESLCFLATGRSHRTNRDHDLIRDDAQALLIKAQIARRTNEIVVELGLSRDSRKQLKINGVSEKKIAYLVGNLAVVFFSPDDLQLLKGPPALRRRFLDIELSQISRTYLHHLMTYNRMLLQRNTLLKTEPLDAELLSIYTEQLILVAAELLVRRARAIQRLSPVITQYHNVLSEGKEQLYMEYQSEALTKGLDNIPGLCEINERLRTLFNQHQREEIRRQQTVLGPHRDDLIFKINGKDARFYASQGQQRTAVLALKLAELQFMSEELEESPVLILDDVTSELDPTRRRYLLNSVQEKIQTFISCTNVEDLAMRTWSCEHTLFQVHSGHIELAKGG